MPRRTRYRLDVDKTEEGDPLYFVYGPDGKQVGDSITDEMEARTFVSSLNKRQMTPEDVPGNSRKSPASFRAKRTSHERR